MDENGIDVSLKELHAVITNAVFPEDVFGKKLMYYDEDDGERESETIEEQKEALSLSLKEWRRKCDSKNFFGKYSDAYSDEAMQMLTRLYYEGLERIQDGEYGTDLNSDFRITIGKEEVELRKYLLETKTYELYSGNVWLNGKYGKKVIAKIASKKEDNRFLENEIRVLRILSQEQGNQIKHYPPENRTFKMSDGRLGAIMDFQSDYYSLEEVRRSVKWQNGVPEKHMVWMLNRALSGIGFAHERNVIHCNLNPENVIIRPRDHNLIFANWDYALLNAHNNTGVELIDNSCYFPPEQKDGERLLPSSDLFAIGKLMIYILGGDPETNEMPDSVNPRIQSFLKSFVLKSKWQRVSDAWMTHGELIKLIEELWGKRKFLKFSVFE